MKNNYRKLKLSILLQTVFITALTVLVGRFILEYFIDGIYNDSFANGFLRILEAFHVSEETATSLYWQWIGNNKVFFMILGFLLLFSLFFYVALSKNSFKRSPSRFAFSRDICVYLARSSAGISG